MRVDFWYEFHLQVPDYVGTPFIPQKKLSLI